MGTRPGVKIYTLWGMLWRLAVVAAVVVPLSLAGGCFVPLWAHASGQTTERAVQFRMNDLTFDAILTEPASPRTANGWGVLLVGGGLANDLDWRIPSAMAMTPEARGDGALLADHLAARGVVVLRWSTLAVEDPLRGAYPERATPRTYAELLDQARSALRLLVEEGGIEDRRLIVVGYSLGSVRALELAGEDPRVAAVVLLSGARMVRLAPDREAESVLRRQAEALIASADRDRNGTVDAQDFVSEGTGESLLGLDRDGDGKVVSWEVLTDLAGREQKFARTPNRTMPWGEDHPPPKDIALLLLGGGLDDRQAPQSALFFDRFGGKRAVLRIFPQLGHTLGREAAGKVAPIDSAVLDVLSGWVEEQTSRRAPGAEEVSPPPAR